MEAVKTTKKVMGRPDRESCPNYEVRADTLGVVDPHDAAPKKPAESFVTLPPSLQDLGNGNKVEKEKKTAVDLKQIREKHEKDKQGDK